MVASEKSMMKQGLAILGSPPLFDEPRHVGAPYIPNRAALHASLDSMLDARRLTNDGAFVRRLETKIAEINGAQHAVAMCNATLAMQLLFRALGLKGEVIMPAFTFIATAHAARWEGLEPVFVDIEPSSHCINPASVSSALTDRTVAIMGVHLWGGICDVDALEGIAGAQGIPLLFDAAHAMGCSLDGRMVGSLGAASVLSLHATKVVSAMEGGVVLTDDLALASKLRQMRNFGFEGYDRVGALGINAKMNEFSAAFAIAALEDFDFLVERNAEVVAAYRDGLKDIPGITLFEPAATQRTNHHYVVLSIDPVRCPLDRDALLQVLLAENVVARRYFFPGCHRAEPYASEARYSPAELEVTEDVAARVLVLPAGSAVTLDDVRLITRRMRVGCELATAVRRLTGCAIDTNATIAV